MDKTHNNPRISILIPSLNTDKFLVETIESVTNQSYENWEIIFLDGGSTDRTLEIMEGYTKKYPNIHVLIEPQEGPYDAIHRAAKKAKGEFIYVLAISDGYIDNEWLEKCTNVMDNDKEISLAWGIPIEITEEGETIGPNYIYAHFLKSSAIGNTDYGKAPVMKSILTKFNPRYPKHILAFLRKMNFSNLRTFRNMTRKMDPPQKKAWFDYWLSTGQIFPDGNMCVARKAFFECLRPYKGNMDPGDWMGFYLDFNSKGYLAYCIPTPANFGRVHGGQVSEVWKRYNDQNRIDYYKKLKSFKKKYYKNPEKFNFRDRDGNKIPK